MQIAELEEFTSRIDFILKRNYHQNLNYFYLIKFRFLFFNIFFFYRNNNSNEKLLFL